MEQVTFWDDKPEAPKSHKSKTYEEFVEKFKPKKTTDDCYTPPIVFDAIADWVADRYDLDRSRFVRPFFPGGDYLTFDYPAGAVVVDNPPFSILSKIVGDYTAWGMPFFLFAPTLTLFSSKNTDCCCLPIGGDITYENGATINTSFVTNLEPPETVVHTYPDLYRVIDEANAANLRSIRRTVPKYSYPDNILTAAMAYRYSEYGVEFILDRREAYKIEALDSQRDAKKAIFGKGFLLSSRAAAERAAAERAAAERAAAERAAATRWHISDREREIIHGLDRVQHRHDHFFIFYQQEGSQNELL